MSSNLTNTIYNNELFKKIDLYHKKTKTEVKKQTEDGNMINQQL